VTNRTSPRLCRSHSSRRSSSAGDRIRGTSRDFNATSPRGPATVGSCIGFAIGIEDPPPWSEQEHVIGPVIYTEIALGRDFKITPDIGFSSA
jgi:hypothetical protein